MATADTNVQALEKELIIYEPDIPKLMEMDMPLYSMLETTTSNPASNRATRVPLLQSSGGTFQQVDMDGGDLGASSGPNWITATLVPYYFTSNWSITALASYATEGSERAVENAPDQIMKMSMERLKSTLDVTMNTAGNAVIGTVTSVSTNTLTMTTDGFKEQMPYIGMPVQIFSSALTVDRGSSTVTNIDRTNHTITLAAAPGGTTGTDLVLYEGVAAPVTIQSGMFGVKYHQSNATTGLWQGLNRATYSNIITPGVNAGSSGLTTAFIRLALNNIRMNIGDNQYRNCKLTPYMHPAQADAYEAMAILASEIFKEPSGNQGVDLMFGNEDAMSLAGRKIAQSIHADRTRIDFLPLKYWGKIVGTDTGFYKSPNGGSIFWPVIGASGDSLKSTWYFILKAGVQLYTKLPLAGSYIHTLAVPAGY